MYETVRPFENRTQKASRKWPFENRTVRISDVYCIPQFFRRALEKFYKKVDTFYSGFIGNAIGLILPDDLPGDELQVFDVVLDQLTLAVVERRQDQDVLAIVQNNQLANEQNEAQSYEEYMEFSTKLSSGLVKGKLLESIQCRFMSIVHLDGVGLRNLY
jgi:hypothetical protein